MDVSLWRREFREDGVFGELLNTYTGQFFLVTLEHSYSQIPKLPPGKYACKRGSHRLASMTEDFETFEVMDVPGHTGILFHCGNYNQDSDGCILVGTYVGSKQNGGKMICASRSAFKKFMEMQEGCDEFILTVEES